MTRKLSLAIAAGLVFIGPFSAAALGQGFELSLDLANPIVGEPGDTRRVSVSAVLGTPRDLPGPQGWSIALEAGGGCRVLSISREGTASAGAEFFQANVAADGSGAVLGVVLSFEDRSRVLDPAGGLHVVAAIDLESRFPGDASCETCRLDIVERLSIDGRPPIRTEVSNIDGTFTAADGGVRVRGLAVPLRMPRECSSADPVVLTSEGHDFPVTELTACSSTACFAFRAEPGKSVLIELTDRDPRNESAVFVRWGEPASPTAFDLAAAEPGQSSQRLVIPAARSGTGFVTVQSTLAVGEGARVELFAVLADLSVETIGPRFGVVGNEVSAVITGGGFARGVTAFTLTRWLDAEGEPTEPGEGGTVVIRDVTIVTPARAEVSFDLAAAPAGTYRLVATGAALPATLERAFRVVGPAERFGLDIDVIGHSLYGFDRPSRMSVHFANDCDAQRPAPLFQIIAEEPEEIVIRLARERDFGDNRRLALGINPGGLAGILPALGAYRLPFVFRRPCEECVIVQEPLDLDVLLFTPCFDPDAPPCPDGTEPDCEENTLDWAALEPPEGLDDWETIRDELAALLGDTWSRYHASLARIATRLTRRGVEGASAEACFAFAVRQARGESHAAIVGEVRLEETAAPLAGVEVVALREDPVDRLVAVSSGVTDSRGSFAIDCLEHGEGYTLAVRGHFDPGEPVVVTIPVDEDAYSLVLSVSSAPAEVPEAGAPCEDVDVEPLVPPRELFTKIFDWDTAFVGPIDPNKKEKPPGQGNLGFVGLDSDIVYTIFFENDEDAPVPAQRVTITDRLDEDLDCNSIVFLDVEFGGQVVHLDAIGQDRSTGYHDGEVSGVVSGVEPTTGLSGDACRQRVVVSPLVPIGDGLFVEISAELDPDTRVVTWVIQTLAWIDDGTGTLQLEPPDVTRGFLPPDGEGSVTFSIRTVRDLPPEGQPEESVVILNGATIKFDSQVSIETDVVENGFSLFGPTSSPTTPAPEDGAGDVPLCPTLGWARPPNGYIFDVVIWPRGRRDEALVVPALLASDLALCDSSLPGGPPLRGALEPSTVYEWQVLARNKANLPESGEASAIWSFTTETEPVFRRGDSNDDGTVSISDAPFIFGFLFLGMEGTVCADAADANGDDLVNISDGAFLLNFLFIGGPPPPAPGHRDCGPDETEDSLALCESTACG